MSEMTEKNAAFDDGVVKYSLEFEPTKPLAKKECKKIEKTRQRLYSLGLIGAYDNGIGYGNISLRYKSSNKFLITATQTGECSTLKPKQYSLVKKVNFDTFKTYAMGSSKPSSESITHAAIYNLHKDINAVIHVHNEKLWNFMLENSSNGYLSTNDTPYGTPEMVEDINAMYKNISPLLNNAFVMKGHFEGIVTFGKDLKEAEEVLYKIIKQVLK